MADLQNAVPAREQAGRITTQVIAWIFIGAIANAIRWPVIGLGIGWCARQVTDDFAYGWRFWVAFTAGVVIYLLATLMAWISNQAMPWDHGQAGTTTTSKETADE